jgi:hypothetical protein
VIVLMRTEFRRHKVRVQTSLTLRSSNLSSAIGSSLSVSR